MKGFNVFFINVDSNLKKSFLNQEMRKKRFYEKEGLYLEFNLTAILTGLFFTPTLGAVFEAFMELHGAYVLSSLSVKKQQQKPYNSLLTSLLFGFWTSRSLSAVPASACRW